MKKKTILLTLLIILIIAALAYIFAGDVLYFDYFWFANSGWDRYTEDAGSTDYEDGGYKFKIASQYQLYWANPYKNFDNVIVEVKAQKIAGEDDMQYGVI